MDDLKDYRPRIKASKKAGVLSPLARFNFSKQDIRDISRALGFPWWDKPAQPCLSSRFPYGNEITSERLKMVEKAEEYLKVRGLSEVRVRCQGTTARIEIPKNEFEHFFNKYNLSELANAGEIPVIAIALLPNCSNANDVTNVLSTPPE